MKKLKFLLLFLLFTTGYLQAQWHRQEAGTTESLNDVFCINTDTVFAVGNAGVILKTTDGGENWIQKSSPFTGYLWKIRFANDTTGYAIGENGIIKTTNCGETWITINAEEDTLYSVTCVNKDTVYISGLHGIIKKTENGGETWTPQTTGITETILSIQFVNDTLGFATGGTFIEDGYFLKTIDAGLNWQANEFIWGGGGYSLFFCNDTLGYFGTGEQLNKTIDAGENWSYYNIGWFANVYSIFCDNTDTLWVAGWEAFNTSGGVIAKSTIGGEGDDAFTYTSGYHEFYNSIHFANDTVGYVVGFVDDGNSGWEGLIKKNTTGLNISGIVNLTEKKSFSVYPNPSKGKFIINFENSPFFKEPVPNSFREGIGDLTISDITGKIIMTRGYIPMQIDISNYPKGIYFITIKKSNYYETQKIIIQ